MSLEKALEDYKDIAHFVLSSAAIPILNARVISNARDRLKCSGSSQMLGSISNAREHLECSRASRMFGSTLAAS